MKTMSTIMSLAAGIGVAGILSGIPAAAHHSTAAFDSGRVVRIEGTITQFRWINPHASLKLEGIAVGTGGEDDYIDGLWTVEMTAANVLVNQGWTRNAVRPGDEVVMFVNPLRNAITLNDGSQGGLYVGAVLADGSTLGRVDGEGSGTDE